MSFARWIREQFAAPTIPELVGQHHQLATTQPKSAIITVGNVFDTEYFPGHIGIHTNDGTCRITEDILDRMIFCLGEIGSGKTTGALQVMQQVAQHTDRDIFFLNYKGDEETNQKARRILCQYRGNVPIIRIGSGIPGARYNPFAYGDGLAIANRWMQVFTLAHYEGGSEHYADLHRSSLLLMCLIGEPPRSLEEFRKRLNPGWLDTAYAKTPTYNPPDRWMVDALLKKERGELSAYQKLGAKAIPILKQLEPFVSEDGWTPDDGSAVISVSASQIPDTARKIAEIFIEDFKHFMSARQKRPAQLFWDEFQAAKNQSITDLLSQARQYQFGALLSTQDVNKLGNELEQKILTSDTTTVIAFRTQQSAEFVAKLAGTIERPMVTMHLVGGQLGDEGSVRPEPKWRIDPNDLAKLADGYAYILRQRTFCKVRFNQAVISELVPPEPDYSPSPPPIIQPVEKPKVKEHT